MKKLLLIGVLVMGTAAPAQARRYSDWTFECAFRDHSNDVSAVSFEVWDEEFGYEGERDNPWRPRRPPTWKITATTDELAGVPLTIRGQRGFLGIGRTCEVVSNTTGQKLSFAEAWVVFGDIQRERQALAKERKAERRQAIRERLGIVPEGTPGIVPDETRGIAPDETQAP